ncbi:MAG: hypothetical protein ABR591_13255, partial [Candidatus Velthaea sp.]
MRFCLRLSAGATCAAAFLPASAAANAAHPFTIGDWQNVRRASPRAVAPDARTILYEATHGQRTGGDVHEWFTIRSDGERRRKIILPKSFHPFGFTRSTAELYGTVEVRDKPQLAVWTIGARRARALSAIAGGVSATILAPDGARYAVLADPRPPDSLEKTRTVVRNDASSLYVLDASGAHGAWWCAAHDHIAGFAWSPDGARIAVLSQTPKLGYHAVRSSIEVCGARAATHVVSIPNAAAGVAWADGGRELAFLTTATDVLTPDHLWTVAAGGGTPRDRTPELRASVSALRGDAHGNVWATVAHGVQTEVHR